MPMYTPADVAKRLGISPSTVRNYARSPILQEFLSPEATPARGAARRMTDQDVIVIRFTHHLTRQGISIADVADRIRSGELEQFSAEPELEPERPENNPSTAIVVLNALQSQLADARQREHELTERLLAAERKLGQLEGELATIKQQRPLTFWQRLFRGE